MPRLLIIAAMLALTLSGCASHPFSGESGYAAGFPDKDRIWHALPAKGTRITVSGESGPENEVTVLDSYKAASGRVCAVYTRAGNRSNDYPAGLACRNGDRWVDVPYITNPDSRRATSG